MSDERPENDAERVRVVGLRAELALQAAGLGELEWTAADDTLTISERASAIWGVPAGRVPGEGGRILARYLHPDDRPMVDDIVRSAMRSKDRYEYEARAIRPDDGRTVWIRSAGVFVRDEAGAITAYYGLVEDITQRKIDEAQRDRFVAELDHRVKNVLASVQSLAAQSASKTTSVDVFLKDFAGRLEAMASAHTLLTATRWRGAEIGNIAAAELGGLAPGQARWEGPEIVLNPRATNSLTLALHELATNALKYGALSVEGGRIEVRWRGLDDGGFELTWQEKGGPSVSPPSHQGFGSTLLQRVTGRELGGSATIEFRPDGVRATLISDASALIQTTAPAPSAPAQSVAPPPERSAEATEGASHGSPEAAGVEGVKVLIVEDAMLLSVELEAGLTDAGADVVGCAATVEEGLALAQLKFDVAVLDANLNGQSVTPVAEFLRQKHVPFIFATGYGDAGGAPEGFDAPVVRKPYNVAQIAVALTEAMGRA
ncbi:MAG: HWE histidine kinase domain-containing protein [Caulobacteraceae bacterium]